MGTKVSALSSTLTEKLGNLSATTAIGGCRRLASLRLTIVDKQGCRGCAVVYYIWHPLCCAADDECCETNFCGGISKKNDCAPKMLRPEEETSNKAHSSSIIRRRRVSLFLRRSALRPILLLSGIVVLAHNVVVAKIHSRDQIHPKNLLLGGGSEARGTCTITWNLRRSRIRVEIFSLCFEIKNGLGGAEERTAPYTDMLGSLATGARYPHVHDDIIRERKESCRAPDSNLARSPSFGIRYAPKNQSSFQLN